MSNYTYRIVADSAADLFDLGHIPFGVAPLKVITADREFTDREDLDVKEMVAYLQAHKGKSSSSCPNPDEWLKAFADAERILAVTITSGLSGSYAAAEAAKRIYEEEHPERQVFVVDSLSAGPGERLLVERAADMINAGMAFEEICRQIIAYRERTGLLFVLESLHNFANNGRVSYAAAKAADLLGLCIVGKASDQGTLALLKKCRGWKKATDAVFAQLQISGFSGGKIRIDHCFNQEAADCLKQYILEAYPHTDIQIRPTGGLCSFYAEQGGLLISYEKA